MTGLWIALIALWSVAFAASWDRLTPQERRGKQIYINRTSASGAEITAFLGENDAPGSLMACANCHGFDGRGKPEGGVIPSNITWEELAKSYGHTHASGRRHPAYTGLAPPITYHANRRIGALGAYVVAVDLEKKSFTPASEWIKLN